ncbi:MAG: histidinol-phosphatase HisJ [Epsilonproteobacteria bacterium]|nr:histidinol-phosphatase HisJ [Campylobacterota bacterium]
MRVDLHNHTPLCNHATGSPREFIKEAINQNIDIFGFSDHAPMEFDKKYRMSFSQMKEYEEKIKSLKEEFKDKIDIRVGYEVDFLPGFIDKRVIKAKVDYLIGSVHFIKKWGFDNPEFIGEWKNKDIDKIYEEYFEAVKNMAKSGLFQIVGHLDLIKVFNFKPKKDIRLLAKEAIKEIKRANMVVELNSAGFRKPVNEPYPSKELLQLCYEEQIEITFGSDAHKIGDIGYKYSDIISIAKEIGYKNCVSFINKDRVLHNF